MVNPRYLEYIPFIQKYYFPSHVSRDWVKNHGIAERKVKRTDLGLTASIALGVKSWVNRGDARKVAMVGWLDRHVSAAHVDPTGRRLRLVEETNDSVGHSLGSWGRPPSPLAPFSFIIPCCWRSSVVHVYPNTAPSKQPILGQG